MKKKRIGKNAPNYIDGRSSEKHYCIEGCGNIIDYSTWKCGSKTCKYCSLKGENNGSYIDGHTLEKHNCIDCGKEIGWQSKRCKSCARKGDNNPSYIDGSSFEPYTLEFNSELKESIRTRDNFECQNCGMTEEEHLIVKGRILDIHHIDYNKKNCKENNLITVCQACNLRANFNRGYWQEFYQNRIKDNINGK